MRTLAAVAVLGGMLGVAHAEERNPLEARFIADAGWFLVSTDTRVRVDGETSDAVGSDINFDDTFGIGDFDRFRGEVAWRMAARHVLRAMYFKNDRSATRTLERDVSFDGETFPANASVAAASELSIVQLSYDYAFVRKPTYEIAAGIGVHYVDMAFRLDAEIIAPEGTISGMRAADATTGAPLPVVGVRALWRFAPNWYVTGQAQYFHLKFDPYEGSLIDLKASLVWQFSDHVGCGLGYDDFGFRFDVEDEGRFNGRLRWDYGGATAFVSVMF